MTEGASGLALAVERIGPDGGPGVILAHGFGQTRHAWRRTAEALAATGRQVILYDARGHGDSGRPGDGRYAIGDFVADLRTVAGLCAAPPVVVGASMGGLTALLAHGEAPGLGLAALVLVDIAPRWQAAGVARMIRFMRDHEDGFASLDAARAAIGRYLSHRSGRDITGSLEDRLKYNLRASGDRWRWHWDPRLFQLVDGAEAEQPRLAAAARRVDVPVLLVSGGLSDILGAHEIAELRTLIPHAEWREVPRAAHMVAGDDNEAFNEAILSFLTAPEIASGREFES